MLITKSLFVDYQEMPKVAWWKQNNRDTYDFIKGLEDEETADQMIQLGQQVEDIALEYLERKTGEVAYDLFQDNPNRELEDENDRENADMTLPKANMEDNVSRTKEALQNNRPLLYQAGFLVDNLFVRSDFMVLNENGNYDLYEVKAKTHVRKDKTFQKQKHKNV
ncbi:MAG: hypothetical protein U9Q15_01940 [Patescibacteria group bacterium]|nr:hypothetical protein [Patescibacteria group bacterium]